MMATNRIRIDLSSNNNNIVGLVLCVLSEICTSELARDLHQDVLKVNQNWSSVSATARPISERKPFWQQSRLSRECRNISPSFCRKFQLVSKKRAMEFYSAAWPFWRMLYRLMNLSLTIWLSWFLRSPEPTDWLLRNTMLSTKLEGCKILSFKLPFSSSWGFWGSITTILINS